MKRQSVSQEIAAATNKLQWRDQTQTKADIALEQ
jgi:hypothetical protein